MRKYQREQHDVMKKIICNKCGKEIEIVNDRPVEDYLFVEKRWGYDSRKDNEVHSFDLCEACYDEWTASFSVPVDVKE